jgi:hypothetical protein
MKELRLTFKTADFGAISQVLIDRGISFQVEPIVEVKSEPAATRPPRRPAKKAKKTKAYKASQKRPGGNDIPLAGAERLREALGRTTPPPSTEPPPPGDKSD